MKRQDYPAYQAGIQFYLACENQSFTRLMRSPELGSAELCLLKARKLFSLSHFREAIVLLGGIHSPCEFLNAEKNLLMATAFSNLGEMENSFLYNSRAQEGYRISEDQRGYFLSTYNLSVDAGNLGLKKISNELLAKAGILAIKFEEKLLIHRARACALSAERNYAQAFQEILIANFLCQSADHTHTNKLDVLTFKVVASDIFFRAGHLDDAEKILAEVRNEKLLKPKARVFFNIAILKFLKGNKLSTMPKHVAESNEYSLKWNLISTLESGDISTARIFWRDLVKLFPNNFKDDFEAASKFDEESLFFSAIASIKRRTQDAPAIELLAGSKMETLHLCLSQSKTPLRKEELIESIWKRAYDPSYDSRFYKLVQRLKDLSLPILNEHRAYYYKSR